jgi:hypothetical protein
MKGRARKRFKTPAAPAWPRVVRLEVRRLALSPGDVLVIGLDRAMPREVWSQVGQSFRAAVPLSVQVVLAPAGMGLSKLSIPRVP